MEKEEFEAFEEDFVAENGIYQVWILGYNEEQSITDFSEKLYEAKDPERTINFAKAYISGCDIENSTFPDDVKYVEVLVETIVELDGCEVNVGNLFDEYVEIEEI